MAILVGMDEAGYGPHLGPLVVASASAEFDGPTAPEPDLWSAMRGHIRRRVGGRSGRLVVCDSKQAYASGARKAGLARLEQAVLGFLAAGGHRPETLADLLAVVEVRGSESGESGPWHRPQTLRLPVACETDEIRSAAENLRKGFEAASGRVGCLRLGLAGAARLNRLMQAGRRNKAEALFAVAVEILDDVRRRHPGERLRVTMDQHGGRRRYGGLLAGAFPMERVERLEESAEASRYRLSGPAGSEAEVEVRAGCESWSLMAALASMAAKYVRELAMRQFNAYFRSQVPDLEPTAGYGRDAWRFLGCVQPILAESGIAQEMILRSR
jgi:hypothetical protein